MITAKHLLFELGSEELPPKTLFKLSRALLSHIVEGLRTAELGFTASYAYATPRRLAVLIENLDSAQPNKTVEKRGPAIQSAFDAQGNPSKAALSFANSCACQIEDLGRLKTDKGEWLSFTQAFEGQSTQAIIADIIRQSINALPIAKRMRWGDFTTEFVRPVHWAVLLYGNDVVNAQILGLQTDRISYGHRFHAPQAFALDSPEHYLSALRERYVIAQGQERQTLIANAAQQAAERVAGIAHIEEDLLEEIAALNEWPVPVIGSFDPRYLALPAEVLITTMQTNQKYFPVKDDAGQLLNHFITFSNIESRRPQSIQHGNERVVTPRLSDAEFFWTQDRKQPLSARVASLASVVFQERLGTLADKTNRLIALAQYLAEQLNADATLAKRAAYLAKTDLMTSMVGEFGNLQGTMGRYYALADGEAPDVALALEEQYFPKQSGGATPSQRIGQILAIAEKIDTLVGIFSVGLLPTGDKDPYALRRAALGVLRIVIENSLVLDLRALVAFTCRLFNHPFDHATTESAVTEFIFDRLRGYCVDKNYSSDEFDAVLSVSPSEPLDFMQRLQAVKLFRQLPDAQSLSAANKRIRNILRKSDTTPATTMSGLIQTQELALLESAQQSQQAIEPLLIARNYTATLNRLALLRPDVDAFFDHVMVMSDDLSLRASRLALLQLLSEQFLSCADISKLQ